MTKGRTLVLNADYSLLGVNPLSTILWQDAIKMEYSENAQVIEYYDDWTVHSPSVTMFVPAIMVINQYAKTRRIAKFCDKNLLLRDNYTCQYCGTKHESHDLTKDHVVPKSHGGKTNWENIVLSCGPCNHRRGNNIQIQPVRRPYKPTLRELESIATKRPVEIYHESWLPYVSSYWNDERLIIKKYI